MSIRRNRYPERDNRDRKQEAMNQLARREALLRAEQQSAAAIEMAKTVRLRALRLAKEAMDRKAKGKVDACAPLPQQRHGRSPPSVRHGRQPSPRSRPDRIARRPGRPPIPVSVARQRTCVPRRQRHSAIPHRPDMVLRSERRTAPTVWRRGAPDQPFASAFTAARKASSVWAMSASSWASET